MKLSADLWILAVFLLLTGCKKQENPFVSPMYDLIVEGGINTYSKHQYIRLIKPVGFANEEASLNLNPISDALVSVNDGIRDVPFTEIPGTGIYTAVMEDNDRYFSDYTLTIKYDHKEYKAVDQLRPVFPIDANYIPLSIKKAQAGGVRLTIPKHTFGTTNAQQWLILPEGKSWDPGKFNESYPYSYSHVYGTPNALHPLIQKARIVDSGINDNLVIYKYSISDDYSIYLYSVFQETDWKGLLSSIPGNVKGNISGNANGFFYAIDVEVQTKSIKELMGN
ncbi:hypothetical protein DBR43_11810 [Pedobacter sp. KBW06]|uniref:DUF4249 family protein n=1 Tax=Pedobacter sp. KBW06 TaxID=2153359 RepID=UPI000F5970CD|nr:DUF4249 family protein [Pedobacter sp. KBW06]RQO71908.1 hypothetical protein DBR43_11810 [Pedobacter sp. KBW06]